MWLRTEVERSKKGGGVPSFLPPISPPPSLIKGLQWWQAPLARPFIAFEPSTRTSNSLVQSIYCQDEQSALHHLSSNCGTPREPRGDVVA